MLELAIYSMVYLGSVLMVYNIYGFVRYAQYVKNRKHWGEDNRILNIPIALLVSFLVGYLVVGIFGNPDIVMSGILFGGSIFVFVMYRMLFRVTERIVENERLESKLMAAEESNQAKTAFLASMSHEMRTPMNVILGLDRIALADPDMSDSTRDQLERIDLSARHLLGLVNNILEMNNLETGEIKITHEPYSLVGALDQVDALIGTLAEEKGLDYRPSRGPDVADSCVGDVMQLKQALLHILDNAIKFTDAPGEVSFATTVEAREGETQTVTFSVSDTGVGISEDYLPHVFDAFSQEDSSSTSRFGGGGLSLALVHSIVEHMGGTIEVASEKGVGTTVVVRMPIEVAEEPVPDDGEEAADAIPIEAELAGLRVLVVEDIDANAEIVEDLLMLEDVETERAENGQVAVDKVLASPESHFDAILMDLRMPVMDGLEATRRIRGLDRSDVRHMPIIALTANAFEGDRQQTREVGMNAHLAKPADADMLYETIRRQVALAQAAQAEELR